MKFLSRKIILTSLDQIPRSMRACPGHLVLNIQELNSLKAGEGKTFKAIAAICEAEDAAEARTVYRYDKWKPKKLGLSGRLAALGVVTKSWHREQSI